MSLHGAYPLAGAYRGKSIGNRVILCHAVSDEDLRGKLKRAAGEALCNKALEISDSCSWETLEHVDCPKCLAIVYRDKTRATP